VLHVNDRCASDSSCAPSWPTITTLAEPSRRPRKNIGAIGSRPHRERHARGHDSWASQRRDPPNLRLR
jgi:hypothetical protein